MFPYPHSICGSFQLEFSTGLSNVVYIMTMMAQSGGSVPARVDPH